MTDIMIDPNVRVANDETYAGFEDVHGDLPEEGAAVTVREPEGGLVGRGSVTRIDTNDRLIYIAVDWATLAPVLPVPQNFWFDGTSLVSTGLSSGQGSVRPHATPATPARVAVGASAALTA